MRTNKFEQIKNFLTEKRLLVFIGTVLLSAISIILLVTVDIRLSWILILHLPFLTINIFLFKDLLFNGDWKDTVESISLFLIVISFLVVIINVFIVTISILGLIIPIYLFLQHWYFYKEIKIPNIYDKNTKLCIYGSIATFIVILTFFLIPTFIANDSSNPREHFSSNYSAVDSYALYYDTGEQDREHVIAQSWFPSLGGNFVHDYINVIWSNKNVNSARGNLIFKNIPKNKNTEIIRDGDIIGYKQGGYFMPLDAYKGDVARILLYMYVTYKDDGLPLEYINLDLLKSWSRMDPVDQREKDRNNLIKKTHGYSNKFVSTSWLIVFVV